MVGHKSWGSQRPACPSDIARCWVASFEAGLAPIRGRLTCVARLGKVLSSPLRCERPCKTRSPRRPPVCKVEGAERSFRASRSDRGAVSAGPRHTKQKQETGSPRSLVQHNGRSIQSHANPRVLGLRVGAKDHEFRIAAACETLWYLRTTLKPESLALRTFAQRLGYLVRRLVALWLGGPCLGSRRTRPPIWRDVWVQFQEADAACDRGPLAETLGWRFARSVGFCVAFASSCPNARPIRPSLLRAWFGNTWSDRCGGPRPERVSCTFSPRLLRGSSSRRDRRPWRSGGLRCSPTGG